MCNSSRKSVLVALCLALGLGLAHSPVAAAPCAARNTPAANGADPKVCLSCHDGTLATNVSSPMASNKASLSLSMSLQGRNGKHPVNVDYSYAYFRKSGKLHSPQALDSRVKLYKGKVTCTSCHDLNSREKNSLAMSNRGSALCLSCHNM